VYAVDLPENPHGREKNSSKTQKTNHPHKTPPPKPTKKKKKNPHPKTTTNPPQKKKKTKKKKRHPKIRKKKPTTKNPIKVLRGLRKDPETMSA